MDESKMRRILVTGGARSGKSRFALRSAEGMGDRRLFIATAQALDEEMKDRINAHRRDRGKTWKTLDEPFNILEAVESGIRTCDVILLDCITLWLTNIYLRDGGAGTQKAVEDFSGFISEECRTNIVMVTNEVGFGIVPENPMAREFRDVAGFANQRLAEVCDEVYLVVCGIPARLK